MAKECLSDLARVPLYVRVSTLHHNQDPELQMRELREYAERRGLRYRVPKFPRSRLRGNFTPTSGNQGRLPCERWARSRWIGADVSGWAVISHREEWEREPSIVTVVHESHC